MQIIVQTLEGKYDKPIPLLFMSDLHYGSEACDERAIIEDLEKARAIGARVIMPGDIFDAVFPKDIKRSQPSVAKKSLAGKDAMLNLAVLQCAELLAPYADLIDMIGLGNHEATIIKYHSTDMVALLIKELQSMSKESKLPCRIEHGGIDGYLQYKVNFGKDKGKIKADRNQWLYILYAHGAGSGARITKGMIAASRTRTDFDYDIFVSGHTHDSWEDRNVKIYPVPGGMNVRSSITVKSGNYHKCYPLRKKGEEAHIDYGELSQGGVKPIGGRFLEAIPRARNIGSTFKRYWDYR